MLAVALAMLGFVGTLAATRQGPGITLDSVIYLSAGRNLAHGHGLTAFTGEPLTVFAPGFPALLALGEQMDVAAEDVARVVNAAAYAAIVILAFLLIRRHVASRSVVAGATALVAVSPILLDFADLAISEPAFIAVTLAFLLLLEVAVGEPAPPWRVVVGLAFLVWLAFLVRYAGAVLAATGVVVLVLASPRDRLREAAARALSFGGLAAIGPAVWIISNQGPSYWTARDEGPLRLVGNVVRVVGGVIAPARAPNVIRLAFLLTVGGLLFALVLVSRSRWRRGGTERMRPTTLVLVTFVLLYIAFSAGASRISGADFSRRILAPIYVPLVVLGVRGFELLRSRAAPRSTWKARVLDGGALAWIVAIAIVWGHVAWKDGRERRWFAPEARAASPLAKAVADLEPRGAVFTNEPFALHYTTGRQPIRHSPGRLAPGHPLRPPTLAEFERKVACGDTAVYLAWFGSVAERHPFFLLSAEELSQEVELTPRRVVDDGTLFEVRAPGAERC